MKDLGFDRWTLVHGFYADSGGFLLKTTDHSLFPVTAKQIHYLVKEKYMAVPETSKKKKKPSIRAKQTSSPRASHAYRLAGS